MEVNMEILHYVATLHDFRHIAILCYVEEILRHVFFHFAAALPASETLHSVSMEEMEVDGTINLAF